MDERTSRRRSGARARAVAAIVLAVLSLGAWAFVSPVGSSPDEDYHLASIWCGLGERSALDGSTLCAPGDEADERTVPVDLLDDAVCHAFLVEQDASCQGDDFGDRPGDADSSDRGNFNGAYPGGFYATLSIFAGGDIEASVAAMRMLNVLLVTALITLTAVASPRHLRPVVLVSTAVSTLSLGTFLLASINPSGWAVLSGAVVFPAALGFLELRGHGWRRIVLGVVTALGVLMAAGARSDAAIFAILSLALALWFGAERSRAFRLAAILPLVLMVPAALSFLLSGQTGAIASGSTNVEAATLDGLAREDRSVVRTLLKNLLTMPHLWGEALGGARLGWLDTPLPQFVPFAGIVCFVGVVAIGLGLRRARKWPALLGTALAVYLVPLAVLMADRSLVGESVQARYILPLLTMLAAVALLHGTDAPGRGQWRPSPLQVAVGILLLAVGNAIALFETARRYTLGIGGGFDLRDPAWWWDGPVPGPLVVVVLGSAAHFALLTVLAWPLLRPSASPATSAPGEVGLEAREHAVAQRRGGGPAVVARE